MLISALIINLLVLFPLLLSFRFNRTAMNMPYGPATPASGILAAVYTAIAILSIALLAAFWWGLPQATAWAQALLMLQITYKVLTWPAVGLANPVVKSNLAIAAFHTAALMLSAAA